VPSSSTGAARCIGLVACATALSELVTQEYKTMLRPPGAFENCAGSAAAALGVAESELAQKMDVFEESLGLILHCSLRSVEAVQTLDMPLLCVHAGAIGTVLVRCEAW
jgi:hypothetical protein